MRGLATAAIVCALAAPGRANPLPPGALQLAGAVEGGTGVDNKRLGEGYAIGAQASWQPMSSEQSIGWAFRWSTMFGKNYRASAARIDDVLRTVTMDLTAGVRLRPWTTPRRYLTFRAGFSLLRSNQEIAPSNDRDFVGPIASAGIDQYAYGSFLVSLDVRYGMISNGPQTIGLMFSAGFVGP